MCTQAGKVVCRSRTLEEALSGFDWETKKKQACWDRLILTLWNFKAHEDHLKRLEKQGYCHDTSSSNGRHVDGTVSVGG
jgi:hypothetical protein